ncbi:hypothetical protein [Roseobacter sp. S98]|uniref:hypothetical protein n=1 Tax=Roseobacter algicola (ex Choi et al. 2025) (nom. illeg.) TaxID=3092138 RepID=UPI003F513A54
MTFPAAPSTSGSLPHFGALPDPDTCAGDTEWSPAPFETDCEDHEIMICDPRERRGFPATQGLIWENWSEFLGDLVGTLCIFAILFGGLAAAWVIQ